LIGHQGEYLLILATPCGANGRKSDTLILEVFGTKAMHC